MVFEVVKKVETRNLRDIKRLINSIFQLKISNSLLISRYFKCIIYIQSSF